MLESPTTPEKMETRGGGEYRRWKEEERVGDECRGRKTKKQKINKQGKEQTNK